MDEEHEAGYVAHDEVNIKEIIRERRKEHKLRQKQQEDLQRIRDMKSSTGIDPIELFPKEVWCMIIDELDAKDRSNLREVHPSFRGLMVKTRVSDILFPQALHVNKLIRAIHAAERGDEMETMRILEYKRTRLRCVSNAMRNSFDSWMADNSFSTTYLGNY